MQIKVSSKSGKFIKQMSTYSHSVILFKSIAGWEYKNNIIIMIGKQIMDNEALTYPIYIYTID